MQPRNEHWHPAIDAFGAIGTRQEWAQVAKNLRQTSAFLRAQGPIEPHIRHVLRDAWSRTTAMREDAHRIRMFLEGPNAGFSDFDHALGYLRGQLARVCGLADDAHYRDWKLPTILATLARILSGGCDPSPRMRFVEWWCARLELLVSAGVERDMNGAAKVHEAQAEALAATAANWARMTAHPGEARVPPFFWHALRTEFSKTRKIGVCYWTAARFGFYAGDYTGAAAAASVLARFEAMRAFEKVQKWPERVIAACTAILARATYLPTDAEKPIAGGFSNIVWLRLMAEARWARGDFKSPDEFVQWQKNT